jgi:alpha-galactosidase
MEVGSSLLRRTLEFDEVSGLRTSQFVMLDSGTDLLAQRAADVEASPEFDFRVDGERVTSLGDTWTVADEHRRSDGTSSLVLRLRHRSLPLDVEVEYEFRDRRCDKRLRILNTGSSPTLITHVAIETIAARIGAPADLQLRAHYGSLPRETYLTGRIDDCAVVLRNARTGESVFALNEVPGHLKRVETGAWFWDGALRLMYDTDLFPFERRLEPGEAWRSARASLVVARDLDGFADPCWAMPAALADVVRKPRTAPLWHFNTWEPLGPRPDEASVRALVPIAGRMGFDVFTVDDGWQAVYGRNDIHPQRFPRGLDGVLRDVEDNGMRLGLWAPLAVVDPDVAASTPSMSSYRCTDAEGRTKMTTTAQGEQVVMCLASGYRDAAIARLDDLVRRYRLAYLKLDLTTMFNAYGEAPGCHGAGHEHATVAESVPRIYDAIEEITAALYREHPELLIDLTFELWGHKHTIDYGLLRAADLDWLSNIGDRTDDAAGPKQARTLLYQRAGVIPVEAMLIGNLQAETGCPAEKFATAVGSCPLLLGDLSKLSSEDVDAYGRWIRRFKALRRDVPLDESFFRLRTSSAVNVMEWDGFARLSRAGEGVIALFRNDSDATHARVQLPLPSECTYVMQSLLDDRHIDVRTAAEFRQGFDLPFGDAPVVVVEMRRR